MRMNRGSLAQGGDFSQLGGALERQSAAAEITLVRQPGLITVKDCIGELVGSASILPVRGGSGLDPNHRVSAVDELISRLRSPRNGYREDGFTGRGIDLNAAIA